MTVTAAIIVRNEKDCIEGCLESICNVVDEIVVVDTGSKDNTIAVAQGFTEQVFHFAWCDDFSAARNAALDHATADYVLQVDADERVVDPDSARGLLDVFAAKCAPSIVGTVAVRSPIWTGGEPLEAVDHIARFFQRGRFFYEGAIHEQIAPVSGEMRVAPTGIELFHTGYAHGPDSHKDKSKRNRRMLRKELEKHPGDEYFLYQFGKTHFAVREYGEAAVFFERALDNLRLENGKEVQGMSGLLVAPAVLSELVVSLAYCYVNTERLMQASDLLERYKKAGHMAACGSDFHHALGYVYLMLGDVPRSRAAYLESLRTGPSHERVVGTGSFASHYHLGLLCEAGRDVEGAIEQYIGALRIKPDYRPGLARCIDMIAEYGATLPAAVWSVCDHEAFSALYLDKLSALLSQGDRKLAERFVEAAGGLSKNLLDKCQSMSRGFSDAGTQK